MIVGIPKEIMPNENRVAAIPDTVSAMISDGYQVFVETRAGLGSLISDEQYKAAGAKIQPSARDLYQQSDVILKVKEPQFNSVYQCHETELMHENQVLIAFLHPASPANHQLVRDLASRGVISLTLDGIPRISRAQQMDALTSMSTCAGYKAMLMAANELGRFMPQIISAVGLIRPAEVLVIGAGVAGLQAIATAKRLGAVVYAADIRPEAAEQAGSLGAKVIDLGVPAKLAIGEGGYARHLPEKWLRKERSVLKASMEGKDIVFCSALVPSSQAPVLLTEEMVGVLEPGSVIVDLSIDQGGNCVLTGPGEITRWRDITLFGIKNVPGLLPESATWLFARNVAYFLHYLTENKSLRIDREDEIIASALTTIDHRIVHKGALESLSG